MWMMVLCCALPLALILFLGTGRALSGIPSWVVLGGVALMVLTHFVMMNRSRRHSDEKQQTIGEENTNKNEKNHSGHGCCH